MFISGSGNVGIGTSTPAAPLHVVFNPATSAGINIDATTNTTNHIAFMRNGVVYGRFGINASSGEFRWDMISSYFPTIYSGGTEAMRIPSTQNVLIGTTTDSGYKLDVNGTARIQSNTIILGTATIGGSSLVTNAVFQVNTGGKYVNYNGAYSSGNFYTYQAFGSWDSYGSDIATGTILSIGGYRASQWVGITFHSNGSERMRINSAGNVGIGTSTPTSTLTVSGSAGTGSAIYAYKSGSTVLDIQGSQGQLFSVIDALSGSLMSVNDVSGLPILEVFSDDRVVMGTYGAPALIVNGSNTVISGSLRGRVVTLSTASATASMDCSLSNFFDLTLSGSMYLGVSNIQPGETINLRVTQPAVSGSLNYTSSIKFPNGLPYAASATSSVVDLISFISFDSSTLYATSLKNLI
jgi:hypothetical protein